MRLKNIIVTGLVHDRLVAYEKLEKVMNGKGKVKKQEEKIRELLREIAITNMMISEWEGITQPQEMPQNLKDKMKQLQSHVKNEKKDE